MTSFRLTKKQVIHLQGALEGIIKEGALEADMEEAQELEEAE